MAPSAAYVRRCERCGRLDPSERWPSEKAATSALVWERPWACGGCGGGDFSLAPVEIVRQDGGEAGRDGR